MSESVLTVVKPGQSISDAVKQSIQGKAQVEQLLHLKKEVAAKLNVNINSLMQCWALGPDHACSIALDYAVGMAQGSGTSKEDFLKGFEKTWDAQIAHAEEVKEEQRKMLLNIAKQAMAAGQPIDTQLVGQIQALGGVIPEDVQKYFDAQAAPAAEAKN